MTRPITKGRPVARGNWKRFYCTRRGHEYWLVFDPQTSTPHLVCLRCFAGGPLGALPSLSDLTSTVAVTWELLTGDPRVWQHEAPG